jgi:uncharacterized membrane protein
MNLAHLHLLLNHWPIIGTLIAFALYGISFVGKNEDLGRGGLIIFAAIALLTIPAFLSGVAAQEWMNRGPISTALMARHENAALLTLGLILFTGTLSLAGLWQTYRDGRMAKWTTRAILLFAILSVITVIRTGNTGGDIRHSEVRENPNAMVAEGTFGSILRVFEPNAAKFGDAMSYTKWCTAVLMDLHFVGLCLVLGIVGLIDLRILGVAKVIPLKTLHQFVPWGLLGLGINVVTGMMTFIGSPSSYIFDAPFWLKLGFLMLLGLNVAAFYLSGTFDEIQRLGAGNDAPISAKLIATSSLVLWVGVVVLGRYIQAYNHTIPLPPGN